MSRHSKSILNDWRLWVAVLAIIGLISISVIAVYENKAENVSNIGKVEEKIKEFTDEEIIEFTKNEIKKKLRYPETVKFQNEQVLVKENGKMAVSIYSISDDKNHEEGRMKFVLGIRNNKGILETYNIATNEESCNTDVAEEFEKLVSEKKYNEIYNNLFTTTLKNRLSEDDFIGYNLDLSNSKTEAKPTVDSNNYLKYVTVTIKDKNGQYWIMIIKNGMIYSFSKVAI